LDDRDDPRFWFQVDADQDPPSYPIAGRGLVTGVDVQGATCDATISIEELTPRITFTKRKFQVFRTMTGRGEVDLGGGLKGVEAFRVEIDAPLLDGMNETED
jgi:hypothetical protein